MLNRCFLFTLIGLVSLSAWAQTTPPAASAEDGAGERPAGRRGMPRTRLEGMARRLAEALNLDEEQRAQYDALVSEHQQRMLDAGQEERRVREMLEEMRRAKQAGDDARAEEIRAQIRAESTERQRAQMRPDPFSPFFDDLEKILRDEQIQKLQVFRDDVEQRGRPGGEFKRMLASLPEDLGLDESQRKAYEPLRKKYEDQLAQLRSPDGRDLMQKLRQAQIDGDEAKAAETRKEIEARRTAPQKVMDEFLTEVTPLLTSEQKTLLLNMRDNHGAGLRGAGDLRALLRAVRKVELRDEQRDQVRTIMQEANKAAARMDRKDKAAMSQFAAETKARIVALLDEQQVADLEKALATRTRPGRAPVSALETPANEPAPAEKP